MSRRWSGFGRPLARRTRRYALGGKINNLVDCRPILFRLNLPTAYESVCVRLARDARTCAAIPASERAGDSSRLYFRSGDAQLGADASLADLFVAHLWRGFARRSLARSLARTPLSRRCLRRKRSISSAGLCLRSCAHFKAAAAAAGLFGLLGADLRSVCGEKCSHKSMSLKSSLQFGT